MSNTQVSPVASRSESIESQRPWWTYGMVWMVISGPLSVVIAALISGYVAWHGQDPVLLHDDVGPPPSAIKAGTDSQTPAELARNHAVVSKH
ncbi:MAG: nitrogen fixation protein FixH [Betaproteobacteria bacterium]|nr:nitrogen fixation protein FixH [Betaproteobacteria bacterium]